jgi:Tfp pilus assembly PilM family ATPase
MSTLFNPLSHAFGLDIGDESFKLIQVTKRGAGKASPYFLTAWGSVTVPNGVMDNGEITDLDGAIELLKRLLKETKGHLRGRTAVASLPEAKTFVKVIRVRANVDDATLKTEVVKEVEENIPLPIDEIYFDWQKIPMPKPEDVAALVAQETSMDDEDDDEATPPNAPETPAAPPTPADAVPAPTPAPAAPPAEPQQLVLIAAAPRELVDKYTALLEGAGLIPAALELEGMAVTRAIVPDAKMEKVRLAMLDIGATRSSLIIYDENTLQISIGIPISGNQITRVVSEKLAISTEEAEKMKIECGLDVQLCEDKMWNLLLPFIDEMSERIRNALRFYRIGFETGKHIDRVYLCGGGAYFKEIDTVLSRKLGIKVRRGNALVNLNPKLPKGFAIEGGLSYTTAIGLALRAIAETEKGRRML